MNEFDSSKNERLADLRERIEKITTDIDAKLAASHEGLVIIKHGGSYFQVDRESPVEDADSKAPSVYYVKVLSVVADGNPSSSLHEVIIDKDEGIVNEYAIRSKGGFNKHGQRSNYSWEPNLTADPEQLLRFLAVMLKKDPLDPEEAERVLEEELDFITKPSEFGCRDLEELGRLSGPVAKRIMAKKGYKTKN